MVSADLIKASSSFELGAFLFAYNLIEYICGRPAVIW